MDPPSCPIIKKYSETPLWYRNTDSDLSWWMNEFDYIPPSYSHWEITIKVDSPDHDGYCSDYDEDTVTYETRYECRSFPLDTWDEIDFGISSFGYCNGCLSGGSGYCNEPTYVKIIKLRKIEI